MRSRDVLSSAFRAPWHPSLRTVPSMHTPAFSTSSVRGTTLIELLTALLLLGILTSLASPLLSRYINRHRMSSVLTTVRGDLTYARMLAVRSGQRVEVRFTTDISGSCISRYDIVVMTAPERLAKRVDLSTEVRGVCLTDNGNNPLVLNSRGLPRGAMARTFTATASGMSSRMTLAQAGRLYLAD